MKGREYLLNVFIPVAKEEAEGLDDVIECLESMEYYLNKDQIIKIIDAELEEILEYAPNDHNIGYKSALTVIKQKISEL